MNAPLPRSLVASASASADRALSEAMAAVQTVAAHRLNTHLRKPTEDEAALLAAAVMAGAHVRSDSSYEDFLAGTGGLPLSWGAHSPRRGWVDGYAAKADARRDAFYARIQSGDLRPVVERIGAERAKLARAA
jgi:hypothetical protein